MKKLYQKIEDKKWIVITYPEQCNEDILFNHKCQGVKGHKGVHWAYNENGSFHWSINRKEQKKPISKLDAVSGMTPPGHEKYISPVDKYKDYYLFNSEKKEITDPKLIKKLENDEIDANENTLILKPLEDYDLEDYDLKDY